MKRKLKYLYLLLLCSTSTVFGFTFSAVPTPETCSSNGTISFSSFNTDPNGTIVYIVYKLPDSTTPYATVSGNLLTSLSAATYRIIAKETVGSTSTQQQMDVVVNNAIVPLIYSVQSLNQACSNTSNIVVTTISGFPVSYEIFSGPVLFPSQASNAFSGLPVGVYKIRVFDACGVGVVQTFTVNQNTAGITIGPPTFSNANPPSCNFTVATNTLTPALGTVLGYPLAITYTVHPPGGGAPIVFNSNLLSGNPTSQNLVQTIPDYINQIFNYDITIVDACGSTYTQNFIVNQKITLSSTIVVLDCNQNYFSLTTTNYTPPYTLNFTTSPAGFNPNAFNTTYPGPFSTDSVQFGDATNPVKIGMYDVTVLDACGRTTNHAFSVVLNPPIPSAVGTNNGCLANSGTIVGTIPSFIIATAIVTAAPSSYPNLLPDNVSSSIVNGVLTLNSVPIGDYILQFTDNCNDVLTPINCNVPVYVNQGLLVVDRPGCDFQKTSIELSSKNGKLTTALITAAPTGFSTPLILTNYIIANGKVYLDDLPAGTYTFQVVDECNFSNTITVNLAGYTVTTNSSSLIPNCGSFNIPLNFVSNGIAGQSFWLQKLIDPLTNTYGSPDTGVVYIEGTVPNATNSYALTNNATNFNITFNGTFRIIRYFKSFNNGININSGIATSIDKDCLYVINPVLMFNQVLEIIGVSKSPCTPSGVPDVIISANGTAPLKYIITSKDGVAMIINNGNSSIFYNLPAGIYTFTVEDNCGNIVPGSFDTTALLSLVNMTQPNDIVQCTTNITGNETFNISQQNSIILGSQSSSEYTLTYYTSQANAQNATNAIANITAFNPTTNPQTIYARLVFNALANCYETRSFDLIVGQTPFANLQSNYLNCSDLPITIDASANNLASTTYLWSTGATTPSVTISQIGTTNLTLTTTNIYGVPPQNCTTVRNTVVTISQMPQIDHFDTIDWTENENSITVFTSNNGNYEYALDGDNYQDSPTFTNLLPGLYTVYVKDKNGCGITVKEIWLLYYEKYFTPNGDGFNETWRIANSEKETNLKVIVYDRYGKTMASFDANSLGWNGTYNGQLMFSDDYWFVVYRQDGRVHRGHFALKR